MSCRALDPDCGGSAASLRGPRICTSAVTAAFVAAWRVSSACGRACVARPCSPASSSSSPELKVLLGGVERGGDEPTPDERALARLSRSCGVCGTAPLAKGGHDGRDRLHLRAERHPNCQAAAREQRDPSRSNPGGRAFPE